MPLVGAEAFSIFNSLQQNLNTGGNFVQSAGQVQDILSYSAHPGAKTLSDYIGKLVKESQEDTGNPDKQYALAKILVELKYIFMKDIEVLDIAGKVLPNGVSSVKGITSNYNLYAESDFGGGTRKNAFTRMLRGGEYGFGGSAEAILGAFDNYFKDENSRLGWEVKDTDSEGKSLNNLMAAVGCFAVQYEGGSVNQTAKGMDIVPPGITSVANGKLVKFEPNGEEAANIIDFFLSREWYAQKMLFSMQAATGLGEALTKERFKELLSTGRLTKEQVGKNVSLDRSFVVFLAGPCGNPSVGIRLNTLTVEGRTTPLAFGIDGTVQTSTPVVNIHRTRVGILLGGKKPETGNSTYTRIDEGPGGTDVKTTPDSDF